MNLFVDTGALIALHDGRDQHHAAAAGFFAGLQEARLVTSLAVLMEYANRGARLVGARATGNHIRQILINPHFKVVDLPRDLFLQALDLQAKYEDLGLSLTDCVSVLILRGARLKSIFTFDQAFRKLGFRVLP